MELDTIKNVRFLYKKQSELLLKLFKPEVLLKLVMPIVLLRSQGKKETMKFILMK